jgi:plasmid replication initiation protein
MTITKNRALDHKPEGTMHQVTFIVEMDFETFKKENKKAIKEIKEMLGMVKGYKDYEPIYKKVVELRKKGALC